MAKRNIEKYINYQIEHLKYLLEIKNNSNNMDETLREGKLFGTQSIEEYINDSRLFPDGGYIKTDLLDRSKIEKYIHKDNESKGLRFNTGKVRYDLLEPYAIEQLAKVFTKGAEKYAPGNWLKGMEWSTVVASLKRHLAAFEQGEDYDQESGLLHAAHVAWNAMALVSYYKHAPQYDDRNHSYMKSKRIGLDVDEVCCDFLNDWVEYWKTPQAKHWYFDRTITDKFEEMRRDNTLDGFYSKLKPLKQEGSISFEPTVYITSRPVDSKITEQWLDSNGFPAAPVVTVNDRREKVAIAKDNGLDYFIDDNFDTFVEMNKAGICCFLMSAPHNLKYQVGYKRITGFKDFQERFL